MFHATRHFHPASIRLDGGFDGRCLPGPGTLRASGVPCSRPPPPARCSFWCSVGLFARCFLSLFLCALFFSSSLLSLLFIHIAPQVSSHRQHKNIPRQARGPAHGGVACFLLLSSFPDGTSEGGPNLLGSGLICRINLVVNPPTPCRIGKRPSAPEDRPAIEEPRGGGFPGSSRARVLRPREEEPACLAPVRPAEGAHTPPVDFFCLAYCGI